MSDAFSGIRGLVFDFDGTLVDATVPICISFNAALVKFGAQPVSDDHIKRLIGHPLRDMFPTILPGLTTNEIQQLIDEYRQVFLPISTTLSKPMPGATAMIAYFKERCAMGIATSRITDGAERILGAMGLLDAFDIIIGLDDVEHPKPHPEPVLKALARMHVEPCNAVMIGDVPNDILAGRAAGTMTIGVASDQKARSELLDAGAHAVIADLQELIPLLTLNDIASFRPL